MEIKDEVKAKAKIIKNKEDIQTFEFNSFDNSLHQTSNDINEPKVQIQSNQDIQQETQTIIQPNIELDKVLNELNILNQKISQIENNINSFKELSVSNKELDAQIVKALKELKQYALIFEKSISSFEEKLLKTSFSIAKKIIGVELSQNSTQIAKETIKNLMEKIQGATKVTIHLNPKDYIILKDELEVEPFVKIEQDSNVTAGGVVIASDLGNFDGNIEAKIESISQTLELLS